MPDRKTGISREAGHSTGKSGATPEPENSYFGSEGELLLDALTDAVCLIATDGTVLAVNAETARRLGHPRETIVGRNVFDLLPPDIVENRRDKVAELLRTGHPVFFEDRLAGRIIDNHIHPVRDADGNIRHIAIVGRDVTAQRTAEEALRASRMLLGQTLRMGKMGGWEWDVLNETMYWSEETYRLHGMESSVRNSGPIELLTRTMSCYDQSAAPLVYAAFKRCVEYGEPYDLEVPFADATGRRIWVRTGGEAIRNNTGAVIRIVGYITDVSERRVSEEALRDSEEKYRTLVDEAAEMLFLHDFSGRFTEVNRAAIEGTGYSREELLNMFVWDIDADAMERGDPQKIWMGMPPGGRALVEVRHRRKDGSEYPAEVRMAKVEFGGKQYMLGLASDISDRRLAEQRQKESEQRLNTLMANLPGMAYRCANDPSWTLEFTSEGAKALTGYPAEALMGPEGVSYAALIHPGDRHRVWTEIQDALQQNRPFTLEYRIHDAQGTEKWVWEKGIFLDGNIIEGFITDITERKRYEEAMVEKAALENQLHHLQKADSLNRMAGAVAHHFNNKLHGVLAGLELVRMQAESDGSNTAAIDIAAEAAQQAADISRLMLTCLGQSRLERQQIDLIRFCRALRPALAEGMPVTVLLELELPGEQIEVWADAHALKEIITNLVVNAWEAERTRRITLRVLRSAPDALGEGVRYPLDWKPEEGEFSVIEVVDDGEGMSATMIEQIFDPFFSTKFTGRGIGLPLVLGLARSHGGGVIVHSEPGQGTAFRVCIPLAGAKPNGMAAANGLTDPAHVPNPVTVLLAEDEAPLQKLAGMMLESLGYRVLPAKDGQEALDLYREHSHEIHCVVTDIRMPRLDGWQLLECLRASAPELPVIFASAYGDAVTPPDKSSERPDTIIRKPYLIKDIRSALSPLMSRMQA